MTWRASPRPGHRQIHPGAADRGRIPGAVGRCHDRSWRSPALVIHDELGRVRGPRSELYDALETGAGA